MAFYNAYPSPAPSWGAASYGQPYNTPGGIFTPAGTVQQSNIYDSSIFGASAPQNRAEDIFAAVVQQSNRYTASPTKTPLQIELEAKIEKLRGQVRCLLFSDIDQFGTIVI